MADFSPRYSIVTFDVFQDWTAFPQDANEHVIRDVRRHISAIKAYVAEEARRIGFATVSFENTGFSFEGPRIKSDLKVTAVYPFGSDQPNELLVARIELILAGTADRFQRLAGEGL